MSDEKSLRLHKLAYRFAHHVSAIPLLPYSCRCEKAPELTEPCLIVANHLTESDFYILFRSFPEHMYFVCGEHLYRTGFGPFIGKFYAPIPAARGGSMLVTIMQILRKLRNGHHVMMFPEGSRSFNGVTRQVSSSVGKLIKKAGCGLVTYRISGGYFVAPRWSYQPRKGHMEGNIRHVYTSAELKEMSAEEITDLINRDILEDAYARQKEHPLPYRSKHLAEGIENYLEICPVCGSYDSLDSKEDRFWCKSCGMKGVYDEYGFLHGTDGTKLPFDNVRDWGYWMETRFDEDIGKRLAADLEGSAIFTEEGIRLYRVDTDRHVSTDLMKDAEMKIFKDRMEISAGSETTVFDYAGITDCSLLYFGKTWLFTHKGGYYGITGDHFHAWKLDRLFQVHFRSGAEAARSAVPGSR